MQTSAVTSIESASLCNGLVLNVPHFFRDENFLAWLNNKRPKLTWHERGKPASEWSDVVVMVDPSYSGEGCDSDMPEQQWNEIVSACMEEIPFPLKNHVMVRLTNLTT